MDIKRATRLSNHGSDNQAQANDLTNISSAPTAPDPYTQRSWRMEVTLVFPWTLMLLGLSSRWGLTFSLMIWERMGLCKSNLTSTLHISLELQRGHSCHRIIKIESVWNSPSSWLLPSLTDVENFPLISPHMTQFSLVKASLTGSTQ